MDSPHIPYFSLEQFRNAHVDKYIEIYKSDVVVQEKIHGSNILILGYLLNGRWEFKLGSRKRYIGEKDNFNNFQKIFKEHKSNFIELCDHIMNENNLINPVIRIYGEIFGGKYGQENAPGSFKTQTEPNYCPFNDFAFFDIFFKEYESDSFNHMNILDAINTFEQFKIKIPPIVFRGKLVYFLSHFDVNGFKSIVSKSFYDKEFIDSPKATEGVVIRSVDPQSEDEKIVLKYKQTWAVENKRVLDKSPSNPSKVSEIEKLCLDMLNINRIESYNSKNTIDDMTNPRLIGSHLKEIVCDTIIDIKKEFPNDKYPDLNMKKIGALLSKKGFPLFKSFVEKLNNSRKTPEQRIEILVKEKEELDAQINILNNRVKLAMERLNKFEASISQSSKV